MNDKPPLFCFLKHYWPFPICAQVDNQFIFLTVSIVLFVKICYKPAVPASNMISGCGTDNFILLYPLHFLG